MTRKPFKKINIVKEMKFHTIIIFIFIFVLFTTSSCWDGSVGPYQTERQYCKSERYWSSDNSFYINYCVFIVLRSVNKNESEVNACLIVLALEEASCNDKSIYKPYWFF
jgi:hypothetical protein